MALLDLLRTKVRTLEDWSPDVPRSRIDMDALLADMRRSGVATLDSILGEYLGRIYDEVRGRPNFLKRREALHAEQIEQVGAKLRPLMSWLASDDDQADG